MQKGSFSTFLLMFLLIAGLFLLLYPFFCNFWSGYHQTKAIAAYARAVAELTEEDSSSIWESANAYNSSLRDRPNRHLLTPEQQERYDNELNILGTGIMAYIEIPAIDVYLPVCHGTKEEILQTAVGHLDWSSLPVGGESSHCVLSGHRGLPSARLFTDLDDLSVGDCFMLNVLDEVLTYEVDQIRIVLPNETNDLLVQEGKDFCTLVTCTPYGVNSHRLLVRGHRVMKGD